LKQVIFLASGRGSNFQSFVDHVQLGVLKNISIKGVISNHRDSKVLSIAEGFGISSFYVEGVSGRKFDNSNDRNNARVAFDKECVSLVQKLDIDFIILAGFDQILTPNFVDNYAARILNIHPAYDTKRFGGRNMVGIKVHESVIAQKEKYSGCTVHLVTTAVDEGPAIVKKRVEVLEGDTAENLASRILVMEHLAFPEALQLLVDDRVVVSQSGNHCFVDRYSGNWDIEWARSQEAYIKFAKSENRKQMDGIRE
jgi:phosphoribosylglycinamide formyltransferase 1